MCNTWRMINHCFISFKLTNAKSIQQNIHNPIFSSWNLNQPQQIRGAWNENHAQEIWAPNPIKIMRYHDFNLDQSRPWIWSSLSSNWADQLALGPVKLSSYCLFSLLSPLSSCLSPPFSPLWSRWRETRSKRGHGASERIQRGSRVWLESSSTSSITGISRYCHPLTDTQYPILSSSSEYRISDYYGE